MLNKLITLISCFLIFSTVAFSQNLSVRAELGVGTFRMKDLKDFQASVLPDLGVNVESLSKFPPYYGFGFEVVSYFKSGIGIGFACDFFSTGATNYYEDYSGSYKLNMLTHAYDIGTIFSIRHLRRNHLNSFIEIGQGIKLSHLSLSEDLVVGSQVSSISYTFENTSWWIKPVYRCEYKIFNFLSAGAFLGPELNIKSKLHLKDIHDATLKNAEQDVTIDWTGLRMGLNLSIEISYRKDRSEIF